MKLTPSQAASLSDEVYALTKFPILQDAITHLNHEYGGHLSFYEENMLKGKTGGPAFIKVRTAFGFLLVGKKNLTGNAFILFRGTQYLADWLTNLNLTLSSSASGQPVHDGFNKAFHSMLPQIAPFVRSLPPGTHVHCMGHSLGGALATIAAEWVRKNSIHLPKLYSFGSPRVGLIGFSEQCTRLLNDDNIFRAYHRTDIVPCIPIWPFVHTPSTDRDFFLPSPGLIPWKTYHDMGLYQKSVARKSWDDIKAMRPPAKTDSGIEAWLKSRAIIGQTMSAIEWLNDAIIYVVKKCMEFAGRVINFTATTYFTLMDQLAMVLDRGMKLLVGSVSLVMLLVEKIMQFLGMRKAPDSVSVTQDFLRNLLMKLSARVNDISKQALSATLAEGRGI